MTVIGRLNGCWLIGVGLFIANKEVLVVAVVGLNKLVLVLVLFKVKGILRGLVFSCGVENKLMSWALFYSGFYFFSTT